MTILISNNPFMAVAIFLSIVAVFLRCLHPTEAQIGVCNGMQGSNLPPATEVVKLYKSNGIKAMRLYQPHQPTLQALQGSGIQVLLGVYNDDIPQLAANQIAANNWVLTNVVPYAQMIKYIAVGNEVDPKSQIGSSVQPAMQNILKSLVMNNLGGQIKVSTSIDTSLIKNSDPPSTAEFSNLEYITPIIDFLKNNDSPVLVNIQPYTSYIQNRANMTLEYVLFTAPGTVFTDPYNGLQYQNLFDALYDSVDAAVQKVCASHTISLYRNQNPVKIVSSESGYPSGSLPGHHPKVKFPVSESNGGDDVATMDNAKTYYTNLIKHVKQGTPLRPGQPIETYLFAMFDEDMKTGDDSEHCYGIFTSQGQCKYGQLNFS